MKKLLLLASAIWLLFLLACSNNNKNSASNEKPAYIKFTKHYLNDDEGLKMQVCSFLAPEGWTTDATIQWNLKSVQLPASAELKITKPGTSVSMQGFPDRLFLVTADPDFNDQYPAGSKFFAATVVNTIPDAVELIKSEIIPMYRKVSGLKVVEEKNLTVEESNHMRAKEFKGSDSKSGVVKIEYSDNGTPVEETIYGTVTLFPPAQGMQYAALSMCYACKAPKGELKANMGTFETVLNSVKMNPKWLATFTKMTQMVMQRAFSNPNYFNQPGGFDGGDGNIAQGGDGDNDGFSGMSGGSGGGFNPGALSDYVSQASAQVNVGIIQTYENQQAGNDRVFEGYSDYMLGYQNFTDPNSGDVYKLSSDYSNAWTDNSGSVIMSNDVGFDPNVGGGSGSSWTSLSPGGTTVASSSGDGGE